MSAADKSPSLRAQAPSCRPVPPLLPILGPGWARPRELLGLLHTPYLTHHPLCPSGPFRTGFKPCFCCFIGALGQVCTLTSLSLICKMGATATQAQPLSVGVCHSQALFYPPSNTMGETLLLSLCIRRGQRDEAPLGASVSPSAEGGRWARKGDFCRHSQAPQSLTVLRMGAEIPDIKQGSRRHRGASLKEGFFHSQLSCLQLGHILHRPRDGGSQVSGLPAGAPS